MIPKCSYFVLILLLVDLFSSITSATPSNITRLNDEDFSDKTKSYEWSMVVFIRNWCTRSKLLMKEIDKAANFIKRRGQELLWGKIDCETDGINTCEKYSVSNVPALFLFKQGNYFKEFLLKPDYIGIIRFVKSETGPGYAIVSNDEDKEVFFAGREAKLLGTFKSDSPLKTTFLNLVDEWKHQFDFGLSSSEEGESILLYRPQHLLNKFEADSVKYDGTEDTKELEEWMNRNKHGIVGHRHKYNHNDFSQPLVVVYYDMDYVKNPKTTHYWRNRVLKVAKDFPDYTFAVSAIKDFHKEVVNFGYNFMRPTITPLVCAYVNDKRYPMKNEFSIDEFTKYMTALKNGEVEMHMRSEEIPENNNGLVKIAVAKSFDDVVNNNGKDTLIKFYATWCTWCKKLNPIWEELAEKMKNENVEIVKFNAENNEIPSNYEVNQYPTLYWVPKDSKKLPIVYSGGKSLNDFIEFIAKHSTEELKGFDREGKPKEIDHSHEEL